MRITFGSIVQIVMVLAAILWWSATQSNRINLLEDASTRTENQFITINSKLDSLNGKLQDLAYKEGQESQKLQDQEDQRRLRERLRE